MFYGVLSVSVRRRVICRRYSDAHIPNLDEPGQKLNVVKDLRKSVNQFLLRVHPDFFRKHERVAKVNSESLSKLNNFLDTVESYTTKDSFRLIRGRVPEHFKVQFYMRPSPGKKTAILKANEVDFENIKLEYQFPSHFFESDTPAIELEQEATLYVNNLMQLAGLQPMEIPDEKKDEAQAQIDEQKAQEETQKAKDYMEKDGWVKDVEKQFEAGFSVKHWKFRKTWKLDDPEDLTHEDSIWSERERQIYFSPKLSTTQRALVKRRFRRLTSEIRASNWLDIPIIFTHKGTFGTPSKTPGFLCIPHNFKVEDLQAYIKVYITEIRVTRRRIRNQIHSLRLNSGRLRSLLELTDVKCECSFDQANRVLQELIGGAIELKKLFIESFALHISSKATQISIDLTTKLITVPVEVTISSLTNYLEKFKERLEVLRRSNPFSEKNMKRLEAIAVGLSVMVGAYELLIGHTIASDPYLCLLALYNVRKHADQLRKMSNFRNISLIVSTEWHVDSLNSKIYFPFNFNIEEFSEQLRSAHEKEVEKFGIMQEAEKEEKPQDKFARQLVKLADKRDRERKYYERKEKAKAKKEKAAVEKKEKAQDKKEREEEKTVLLRKIEEALAQQEQQVKEPL